MARDDPKRRKGMADRYPPGGALRRFATLRPSGHGMALADSHPAVVEGRTIFPTTVNPVGHPRLKRLLKSGKNSRKIGAVVTKGYLRGAPIYTLTLEERATCPRSCSVYGACYGNGMPFAQRIKHGHEFERLLWEELAEKQAAHPNGFLVRLHILGDFYSVDYAELWAEALEAYPALHVFGYTAHEPESEIGQVICQLLGLRGDRFHMRFSGWAGRSNGSVVVDRAEDAEHLVCPAQTGKTQCCATCCFCWNSDRTIAFLKH